MSQSLKQDSESVITFTGGLGAQILSAAMYFYLKGNDHKVYANMDYFKEPGKTAASGNKGEVSHWNYELGEYGLLLESFSTKKFEKYFFKRNMTRVISDGADKVRLAIEALRQPEIRELFPIKQSIAEECQQISDGNDYLCIHIRRGDYVNVASHLVDDMDFVDLAKSISKFVPAVIVISDSEVSGVIKESLPGFFTHCSFVIGGNPHTAHALIRHAKYLICSNSQFSLSAALLNQVAQQVFLPTKWFGDIDSNIQIPINALCRFQILSKT
jgi:Glycosyl transferase family 11